MLARHKRFSGARAGEVFVAKVTAKWIVFVTSFSLAIVAKTEATIPINTRDITVTKHIGSQETEVTVIEAETLESNDDVPSLAPINPNEQSVEIPRIMQGIDPAIERKTKKASMSF